MESENEDRGVEGATRGTLEGFGPGGLAVSSGRLVHDSHASEAVDAEDLPLRVQRIYRQGLAATPVTLLMDVAYAKLLHPPTQLGLIVAMRLAMSAVYAAFVPMLPSRSADFARTSIRVTGLTQMLFTAVAMHATEGASSLYVINLIIMGVGFVAFARPRREAIAIQLTTFATLPLFLCATAPFFPGQGASFFERTSLGHFLILYLLSLITGAISADMSDVVWSLRREVFESKRVGRYVLGKRIGRGGMGEVWSAIHQGLGRNVAIKFLHTQVRDETSRRRFEREARATAELRHPNTVRVLDAGVTEDGQPYYAMELLEGQSLRSLVEDGGPLRPSSAVRLIEQAAQALGEAHARGIVHRDVKPENLFVIDDHGSKSVKLLDFGVASVAHGEDDERLTRTGLLVGTPTTIAPEIVIGTTPTPMADVYALGCVLFYALTGSAPYEGGAMASVLYAHVNEPVPNVDRRAGVRFDPALVRVVNRCLAKEPSERFPDGTALAEALAPLRDVAGEAAPKPAKSSPDAPTR